MALYELDGVAPQLAKGAWVADSAQLIGNVVLGENASVWFGTVARGAIGSAARVDQRDAADKGQQPQSFPRRHRDLRRGPSLFGCAHELERNEPQRSAR